MLKFRFISSSSKPLLFGLFTIVCLFAADRIAAAALQWLVFKSDDRFATAYAGGREDDVLVIGSSVSNAMISPSDLSSATNLHVFNLSTHGLDAITMLALIKDYLSNNTPPKIALLDIRSARSPRIWAPQLALYSTNYNALGRITEQYRRSRIPWDKVFKLSRFNSDLLPKTLQSVVDRDDQLSSASNGNINPQIVAGWIKGVNKAEAQSDQLKAFIESMEELQRAGTLPIAIAAPLYSPARPQAATLLRDLSKFLPNGMLVCDFTFLLSADRYFEDPVHLNDSGRRAFNPTLATLVQRAFHQDFQPYCKTVLPGLSE